MSYTPKSQLLAEQMSEANRNAPSPMVATAPTSVFGSSTANTPDAPQVKCCANSPFKIRGTK